MEDFILQFHYSNCRESFVWSESISYLASTKGRCFIFLLTNKVASHLFDLRLFQFIFNNQILHFMRLFLMLFITCSLNHFLKSQNVVNEQGWSKTPTTIRDTAAERLKHDLIYRLKKFDGARCGFVKRRSVPTKDEFVITEIHEICTRMRFMDFVDFYEDIEKGRWKETGTGYTRAMILKVRANEGFGNYYKFLTLDEKEIMVFVRKRKSTTLIEVFGDCHLNDVPEIERIEKVEKGK